VTRCGEAVKCAGILYKVLTSYRSSIVAVKCAQGRVLRSLLVRLLIADTTSASITFIVVSDPKVTSRKASSVFVVNTRYSLPVILVSSVTAVSADRR